MPNEFVAIMELPEMQLMLPPLPATLSCEVGRALRIVCEIDCATCVNLRQMLFSRR